MSNLEMDIASEQSTSQLWHGAKIDCQSQQLQQNVNLKVRKNIVSNDKILQMHFSFKSNDNVEAKKCLILHLVQMVSTCIV